jgi:hypothetical protein
VKLAYSEGSDVASGRRVVVAIRPQFVKHLVRAKGE